MNIPKSISAGDTVGWTDTPADIGLPVSAATASLQYALRSATGTALDVTGPASGNNWACSITAEQTAALNTGAADVTIYWAAYITTAGQRCQVGQGVLTVRPNLAALAQFDGRTQDQRDLEALDAAISARLQNGAVLNYAINGRQLAREPLAALQAMRSDLLRRLRAAQRNQRRRAGLPDGSLIRVRFK
ncbi:hypothetical protein V8J88_03885 [Massilia sp. W12]|uniref:hypothetical protein n=1 Tax=Massilia sp. W12 TaxID=3126507 RepID=UPI0030CBE101